MNTTAQQTWDQAKAKAAARGPTVLDRWRAQRPARAGGAPSVRNAEFITTGSSAEEILDFFSLQPAASGMHVTAVTAMRVAAVFACVQRVGAIATLPVHIYEKKTRKRADIPLAHLLNDRHAPAWPAAAAWEFHIQRELLRGDSYAWIDRDPRTLEPLRIVPIDWEDMRTERRARGTIGYAVANPAKYGMTSSGIDAADVIHIPGFGFDGCRSMSVISWAARQATGNAMAMDEYSGRFFAGGAHPSIVLQTAAKMNGDQITALQTAFTNKYAGTRNAFALPLVLTEGVEAKEISISAEDAQLLEARKFQVVDIARAFGVPPHMIGETSASTSWGSGIEQMGRAFVTYTLQPHMVRIEQELNAKLLPPGSDLFIEFSRGGLMEGDSQAQAAYYRAGLGGPGTGPAWLTVNEVRRLSNLPPIDGGDVIYRPPEATAPAV